MSLLQLTEFQKARLIEKFQDYFIDELATELGQFDVEFLLTFIEDNLGNAYYNKGLEDAQALINAKIELVTESVIELEKPTDL